MRTTLLCEGVICRDHDPASHYDPVALGDALGRRRHKRRHAFLQQARRAVLPCDDRTWGVGAALDSDDARLGRLQPAPASKTSSTAEAIERRPAMFISPVS